MRVSVLVAGAVLFAFSQISAQSFIPTSVENRAWEAGVLVGQPMVLNAKYWFDPRNALDAAAGYSFSDKGVFEIYADYLFTYLYPSIVENVMPMYAGIGPNLRLGREDARFGIRIPIGVEYLVPVAPLSITGEVVPLIKVAPDAGFTVEGGLGVRYVF